MSRSFTIDNLDVYIYDLKKMGQAVAAFTAATIKNALDRNGSSSIILATGVSQFEFLDSLKTSDLDCSCITVFHLDEYKDMSIQHPASFRKYLRANS